MNIKFERFSLENGLKVLICEDHSISKVAVDLIYKVGAKNESENHTGLAHLFEHLMFSGSKNIPDYDTHVQKIGGECNAFTNQDLTNYYVTCPSSQLETIFWLESDRMLELDFSQKNLDVQKSVVIEEFKQRYLNQPYGDVFLHLFPLVYKVHPYQWMTIGKKIEHIEEVTLDLIKDFFFSFYAPNNATLVVSGDCYQKDVIELANKWFAPIPNRNLNKKTLPTEPIQQEARKITLERDIPYGAIYKAYRIPARSDESFIPIDMVTDLLSNGKGTRLYQTLIKDKKVATKADAYTFGLFDEGILIIEGMLAEGVSPETYEEALEEVLDTFIDTLTEEELQRMKNKIESMFTFSNTTILNQAMHLAIYDYLGDPNLINTSLGKYLDLTLSDIKDAFRQYIQPTNCSTIHYLPKK